MLLLKSCAKGSKSSMELVGGGRWIDEGFSSGSRSFGRDKNSVPSGHLVIHSKTGNYSERVCPIISP